MSNRPAPDYPLIKRIMEECEKACGPTELARQLSLNKTLEERNRELQTLNDSLTRTRDSILQRIQELQVQEAEALRRRDDRLEETKSIETQVGLRRRELENLTSTLAERLNLSNHWEAIQKRMEDELSKLRRAIISCKTILAPAYWVRSILEENRPVLFQMEKEYVINFLNTKQPEPNYTHDMGHEIIDYLIKELSRRGTLIPKRQYDIVREEAQRCMNKTLEIQYALRKFIHEPQNMTDEQRTALVTAIAAAGLDTKEKVDALKEQAMQFGVQCPIHRLKMGWSPASLKLVCPTLNCKFVL